MACDTNAWIDREIAECRFADGRLGSRLRTLLVQMAGARGESIPLACQDWANTKAAYRFFSNDRVSEGEILGGHFRSTCGRAAGVGGPSGSARPAASTAARTSRAAIASTPSAGS